MKEQQKSLRKRAVVTGDALHLWSYITLKHNMVNNSDSIYHYTDISGFISIMQNQEFWLSHIRFMNDRKEYLEGHNLCKNIINNLISENVERAELLGRILEKLDNEISTGFFAKSSKDVFSLSLSQSRDSLDLWRGYGRNSGIAIGFEGNASLQLPGLAMMRKEQYEEELKRCNYEAEKMLPNHERLLTPTKIIYDDIEKKEIISEILEIALEHLEFLETENITWAEDSTLDCITGALFDIFPYLKNVGFKNENECRIVENFVYRENDIPLKIYYRERAGLVLPYIKYKLLDRDCRPIKEWPIKEIVIGPGLKQEDVAESVQYFLKQQGLNTLAEKVVCSTIPYVST